MLPDQSLSMPAEWRDLLGELAPVFARRSAHRLFMALACGLILADRGTVTGMAAAAGMGRQWRRACWLFASAKRDLDGGAGDLDAVIRRLRRADPAKVTGKQPLPGGPSAGSSSGSAAVLVTADLPEAVRRAVAAWAVVAGPDGQVAELDDRARSAGRAGRGNFGLRAGQVPTTLPVSRASVIRGRARRAVRR
jgi:hypothetical protein